MSDHIGEIGPLVTRAFVVSLTVPESGDPMVQADALLDLLCDQADGPYFSCDGVDPQ